MLSQRTLNQKTTYYIPFVWNVQVGQIHREKVELWLPEAWGQEKLRVTANAYRVSLRDNGNALELDSSDGHTTYEYTKIH